MYTCQNDLCQRELYLCIVIKKIETAILLNRLAFSCLLTKALSVQIIRKVVFSVKHDNNNTNLYKIPHLPINCSLCGHFLEVS